MTIHGESNLWWYGDRSLGDLDVGGEGKKEFHDILYVSDFIQ